MKSNKEKLKIINNRAKQRAARYRPLSLTEKCSHGHTGHPPLCPHHCHIPIYRAQRGDQLSLDYGSRK